MKRYPPISEYKQVLFLSTYCAIHDEELEHGMCYIIDGEVPMLIAICMKCMLAKMKVVARIYKRSNTEYYAEYTKI